MSDFDLVPVDGGDPVHLPPGETVVGRGPFLGVSDKRVSRQHGLLENLNGQLRLKPIHLNPCFVQSSLSDEPRPLQKDSWHLLHHGDLFSLLPGRFIYEVVAVGGEEHTPRNSQMFDEEELQLSPAAGPDQNQNQNQSPPQEVPTPAALSNVRETNSPSSSPKQEDSARLMEDDHRDAAPSVTRRRVLPAWMMAAVAAQRPSSSQKAPSAVKGSKSPAVSVSSKRAAAAQATPTVSSSPVEAELSEEEEERPRKRTRKMSNREEKRQTEKDVPSEEPSRSELSRESDDLPAASGKGNSSTRTSEISESETDKKPKSKLPAEEVESVETNGGSASKRPVRTACPYGKDCYRKNPLHFQECSHPGDTDYEEEEDEEDEDRPECPYGTDCYRKNPLHRKEYKHTRRPGRAKRRVAKNTPDDEEDEDEEYDDSFIDDDSEDVGDDSDYVPPDSDDDGREDVKRLQREAATFLKRRK